MSTPTKQISLEDLAALFVEVARPNGSGCCDGVDLNELTEDLARVACKHFGGEVSPAGADDALGDLLVTVRANDRLPNDGGIWAKFDLESDNWPGKV